MRISPRLASVLARIQWNAAMLPLRCKPNVATRRSMQLPAVRRTSNEAHTRHQYSRFELAKARLALAKYEFDESKHPRAPAGGADGGQFVKAHDGASTTSATPSRMISASTGTNFYINVDGQPWELTPRELRDWDEIAPRRPWNSFWESIFPAFWTSREEFDNEIRRKARSYRDRMRQYEQAPNPLEMDERRRDRIRTRALSDLNEITTTVDNATFLAGLAKSPLKLGVRTLAAGAEHRAQKTAAAELLAETANKARSTATSKAESVAIKTAEDLSTTQIRGLKDDISKLAVPRNETRRLTHKVTTETAEAVARMPQPRKWKQSEKRIRELYGSAGGRHFAVPKGNGITGSGGRHVDVVIDLPDGRILAIEVKTYNRFRLVNGRMVKNSVPLSQKIRQQILKDVRLREMNPLYDPHWEFLDAPPSEPLRAFLKKHKIVSVTHNP